MMGRFEGKTALVTGAASGIGAAAARAFAAEGARVALLDVTQHALNDVQAHITAQTADARTLSLLTDVSQADQVAAAVRQTVERWGQLDIVFANAGINGVWAPIESITPEEWDRTIDINLKGTFLTLKYAVPHLKVRGGAVVITASVNGTTMFSNAGASVYAVSKGGPVILAKMLALELARYKIRVNAVCPGAVRTNISQTTEMRDLSAIRDPHTVPGGYIPLHGDHSAATPEQIAQTVLFLASDAADHITGTYVVVDGGQSLLQG